MIQLRNLLCVHFTNWLFLRRDVTREHEKQRKIDQEKIQQLEMLLIGRIEAFKKTSKEHEMDKVELKKSVQKK